MVRKICLDSTVLINLLNNDAGTLKQLASLEGTFCTTSINTFELWLGRKHQEPVSDLLGSLEEFSLNPSEARRAADIHRELKKSGNTLDLRDLFIGAICIYNEMPLLTNNQKHLERLTKFGLMLV